MFLCYFSNVQCGSLQPKHIICFYSNRFYVAGHGLQMPQKSVNEYITRFLDPYHGSITIVQCHFGINIVMKSSVRAVMVSRADVQRVFSGVKFYPGMGCYDYGYFKADSVRPPHQVEHNFYINDV